MTCHKFNAKMRKKCSPFMVEGSQNGKNLKCGVSANRKKVSWFYSFWVLITSFVKQFLLWLLSLTNFQRLIFIGLLDGTWLMQSLPDVMLGRGKKPFTKRMSKHFGKISVNYDEGKDWFYFFHYWQNCTILILRK